MTWGHIGAVGMIAGIGFTMALFIAGLAFTEDANLYDEAKLGIFLASLMAAVVGALALWRLSNRH